MTFLFLFWSRCGGLCAVCTLSAICDRFTGPLYGLMHTSVLLSFLSAILEDESKMNEISEKLEKFFKWDHVQNPFVTICRKVQIIFSEETSRAFLPNGQHGVSRFEKKTLATLQCPSCLKHETKGLNLSQCGVWLLPNQSTMERIRSAFAALKTPYFRTTAILSRGRKWT